MAGDMLPKNMVAEFLGTFLLVFAVGCHTLNGALNTSFTGLSVGATLMVLVYALGPVSGAHLNPAVTLATGITGKKPWGECFTYMAIQLAATFFSSMLVWLLFGVGHVTFGPKFEALPMLMVFGVEMLYTFMLCLVVLSTACVKDANTYFGLAIGFVVVAAAYAAGWISGACLNPAVSLGVNMSSYLSDYYFGWFLFYWAAEFVGAAMAATIFIALRPGEFEGEAKDTAPGNVSMGVKCLAEGIGTYFLVLTVGLNVVQGGDNAAAVLSIAASLMAMIYALGPVSGAHLNPAVTVAVSIRSPEFGVGNMASYMSAQFAGGVAAGLSYYVLSTFKSFPLGNADGYPASSWPLSESWIGVGIAEFVFTFVLCYVVLATATAATAPKDIFGLAIGFTVVVGGYAIGPISGGSLNPAVSVAVDATHLIGTAINSGGFHARFWHCFLYAAFECLAGAAAAAVFMLTHPEEFAGYQAQDEYADAKFV
eukprot:Tamp_13917.p1 GENE.Tamp_13917~~Tamp_13917.p1  ORF type:complete len:481 (-),score=73.58 Tamp_13917:184-1626(-)